VFISFELVG